MVKEQPGAALASDEAQHRRLGWKSYAFLALVVGIAAGRLRKQLAGRFYGQAGVQQNQSSRWFAPSEADLMQEKLDEVERKERVRRVQEAYYSRQSSFRNLKSARYQKWEEHPQQAKEENSKDKFQAEAKEKARLRHHYLVLGLDPFREEAFTDEEIKAAFRERALQYHPDKNPDSSDDEMRAKFRELVDSYRAIKMEKNIK